MSSNVQGKDEERLCSPQCVASSGTFFHNISPNDGPNCFRQSCFSADGTTVITYNEDLKLRSFVLPPDLLEASEDGDRTLTPYSVSSSYKSSAFAIYPSYTLAHPSTTLVLQARTDIPITLVNALDLGYSHARYPWIKASTEEYRAPSALTWSTDGQHFYAGGKDVIATFDSSQDGVGPLSEARLRHSKTSGVCGIVSALAISTASDVLAVGTTQRHVALYARTGEQITSWSLADPQGTKSRGNGVTQLEWDQSGEYIIVGERQSDELQVFDIRAGRMLSRLVGRKAQTTMRMGFAAVPAPSGSGLSVGAGALDGQIQRWDDVLLREGDIAASSVFRAHDDAVSAILMHPEQSVFATTSGQRTETFLEPIDGSGHTRDVSLKIWTTSHNDPESSAQQEDHVEKHTYA